MNTFQFDYDLPQKLIAAHPTPDRDASRLMVLDPAADSIEHKHFRDLIDYLQPGDCLVLNDSRVIPARINGKRRTGGKAEVFLLTPTDDGRWRALVKPGKKLPAGEAVYFGGSEFDEPEVLWIDEELEAGERIIRFEVGSNVGPLLERHGEIPLPPYIVAARKALKESKTCDEDFERYQTVYASHEGSVAAPTAGLHYTDDLLDRIAAKGVEIQRVTLHVGPGTFAPVQAADPTEHPMHAEPYSIEPEAAAAIQSAIDDPARRVIASGTTVVRTLEAAMKDFGHIEPGDHSTDLLILPGYDFKAIDALITNFHLPRSTLLMLVGAFVGTDAILDAYRTAVENEYRFYSFGDAMFIRTRP